MAQFYTTQVPGRDTWLELKSYQDTVAFVRDYFYMVPSLKISNSSANRPSNGQVAFLYGQILPQNKLVTESWSCSLQFSDLLEGPVSVRAYFTDQPLSTADGNVSTMLEAA